MGQGSIPEMSVRLCSTRPHGCIRQHYRPLFWSTPEFPISSAKKRSRPAPTTNGSSRRKCRLLFETLMTYGLVGDATVRGHGCRK